MCRRQVKRQVEDAAEEALRRFSTEKTKMINAGETPLECKTSMILMELLKLSRVSRGMESQLGGAIAFMANWMLLTPMTALASPAVNALPMDGKWTSLDLRVLR